MDFILADINKQELIKILSESGLSSNDFCITTLGTGDNIYSGNIDYLTNNYPSILKSLSLPDDIVLNIKLSHDYSFTGNPALCPF